MVLTLATVPTFGNRQFLAMNQTQTFRYRSIKQNKAFFTGPLSKTIKLIKVVKKLFSYHFNMHLFRAQKHFYAGPTAERKHSATGPLSKTKGFCYRLSKQNKTTLRTMSSNFLESTDPSTGNVCFFRFGTMSFKLWESAVPYNDSRLASKTSILTSGNGQFLVMVTSGSQVGNRKFQGLGTGSSLPW